MISIFVLTLILMFEQSFESHPHLICYAVKANSNIAVLNILAKLGSGFDIVSLGELERVITAGGDPRKCVFSGVAKNENSIFLSLGPAMKFGSPLWPSHFQPTKGQKWVKTTFFWHLAS